MTSETHYQSPTMYSIIASSFFQKKSCRLPGIGTLELVTTPAEYDFGNRQIKAPQQKIIFIPSVLPDNVFNEFSAISQLMKEKLGRNEAVEVTGVGTFSKQDSEILFEPVTVNSNLFQPVTAERVVHKDAEHSILVGDKETTNVEMTEYYSEEEAAKDKWWIWALMLGIAGIVAISFYIWKHGFNNLSGLAIFN